MERNTYISYFTNPSLVGKKDKEALEKLISEHPYCQSAYVLLAKVYNDNGNASASFMLRKAALYTSNRAFLKQLIEPQPTESYPSVNLLAKQSTVEEVSTISIEKKDTTVESKEDSKSVIHQINEKAIALNVIDANDQKAQGFIESLYQHLQELSEAKAKAAGKIKDSETPTVESKDSVDVNPTIHTELVSLNTTEETSTASKELPIKDIESSNEIGSILQNIQKDTSNTPRKSDVLDLILGFDNQVKDYFDLSTYELKDSPSQRSTDSEESSSEQTTLPFNTKDWTLEESRMEEVSQNTNELLLNYLQYIASEKQKQKNASANKEQLLIKKFIQEDPTIAKNTYPLQEINENASDDELEESESLPEAYINENFAKTLTLQKNYTQAIAVYEALILKNPEKKSYFASLIEELKLKK